MQYMKTHLLRIKMLSKFLAALESDLYSSLLQIKYEHNGMSAMTGTCSDPVELGVVF